MSFLNNFLVKVYSLQQSSEELLWLWQQKSGTKTNLCCEKLCTNTDIEGTMVFCPKSKKHLLIPLCSEHRSSDTQISIGKNFELIELS